MLSVSQDDSVQPSRRPPGVGAALCSVVKTGPETKKRWLGFLLPPDPQLVSAGPQAGRVASTGGQPCA